MPEKSIKGISNRATAAKALTAVVADIVTAAFTGFPGLSIASEIADAYSNRKREEGRRILIEEIAQYGIHAIDVDSMDEIIGCIYRFSEAVKIGQREQLLRVLARYIGSSVEKRDVNADKFCSFSRSIDGLTEFDMRVIASARKYVESGLKVSVVDLIESGIFIENEKEKIAISLNVLTSRGFFIPGTLVAGDEFWQRFIPTENLIGILKL